MSLLSKLGVGKKREAVKFAFNLSITSLENFDPASGKPVSDDASFSVR